MVITSVFSLRARAALSYWIGLSTWKFWVLNLFAICNSLEVPKSYLFQTQILVIKRGIFRHIDPLPYCPLSCSPIFFKHWNRKIYLDTKNLSFQSNWASANSQSLSTIAVTFCFTEALQHRITSSKFTNWNSTFPTFSHPLSLDDIKYLYLDRLNQVQDFHFWIFHNKMWLKR